jgi:hypothetical protein
MRGHGLSFHRRRRRHRGCRRWARSSAASWAGTLTDRLVRRDPRWQMGVPIVGVGIALPAGLAYLALAPGAAALGGAGW